MRLHYLQHVPFENPGSILEWAEKNNCTVTATQLYANEALPDQQAFDWLVIMGGPMNVYEEADHPWLAAEKAFIRASIDAGKVVIGLCLGGQLIAAVIGGQVTKNPHKEIGWFPVRLTAEARLSPLFSFFPEQPVVFQWHGDTFGGLPDSARPIATSAACRHQAFVYKKRVFAFQYHLENTPEIIKSLIEHCGAEMVPGPYVQTAAEILSHPEHIAQANVWMNLFLTSLEKMYREGKLA